MIDTPNSANSSLCCMLPCGAGTKWCGVERRRWTEWWTPPAPAMHLSAASSIRSSPECPTTRSFLNTHHQILPRCPTATPVPHSLFAPRLLLSLASSSSLRRVKSQGLAADGFKSWGCTWHVSPLAIRSQGMAVICSQGMAVICSQGMAAAGTHERVICNGQRQGLALASAVAAAKISGGAGARIGLPRRESLHPTLLSSLHSQTR